ncbi:MAG: hypothetical protein A2Y65_10375 [Deltaproteobacteria bacterium RBG_13_52_11]|nr:MAG: hypothetical protein A2Y65_10375 [Deltaproteobacteria bacterium RBG_13_52_11]
MYFDQAGKQNTGDALRIAVEEAARRGIRHMVVASTRGDTGLQAAKLLQGKGIALVVVGHNTGFSQEGEQEFDQTKRTQIEKLGGRVYTGTMVLRNLGTAIRSLQSNSQQDLVANTLRMLGQGIKVCVEIAAMAVDAGLIPCEDCIAVAGTGLGADTVAVIRANSSNNFFQIKVREILAKPRDF